MHSSAACSKLSLCSETRVVESLIQSPNYQNPSPPFAVMSIENSPSALNLFIYYVINKGIRISEILTPQSNVRGNVTCQPAAGFTRWQEANGYAISIINVRFTTFKTHVMLVTIAGIMVVGEYSLRNVIGSFNPQSCT